jgi:hypothetical protein
MTRPAIDAIAVSVGGPTLFFSFEAEFTVTGNCLYWQ